jgi:hypothetical protein
MVWEGDLTYLAAWPAPHGRHRMAEFAQPARAREAPVAPHRVPLGPVLLCLTAPLPTVTRIGAISNDCCAAGDGMEAVPTSDARLGRNRRCLGRTRRRPINTDELLRISLNTSL